MFLKFVFFIALMAFISLSGYSQVRVNLGAEKKITQYIVQNWTTAQNLPSNTIVEIFQASQGYIWLGTYGGLVRFDGRKFNTYDAVNTDVFSVEVIKSITETPDNKLWIATQKGIIVYNNKQFYKDPGLNALDNINIHYITSGKNNDLWIISNANQLYNYKNSKLDTIVYLSNGLKNEITVIEPVTPNLILSGTKSGKVYSYNGKLTEVAFEQNPGVINFIKAINPNYFLIVAEAGIFAVKNNKAQLLLTINQPNKVLVQSDSILWIASPAGLTRFFTNSKKQETLNTSNGLLNNLVEDIEFDSEGNLWGATYRGGIFQLIDGDATTFSLEEGLLTSTPTALLPNKNGAMLIGNETGGIDVFYNNKIEKLKLKKPVPDGRLKHMMLDSKGNIWVSTYKGLMLIEKNNEQIWGTQKGFADDYFRFTYEDNIGRIWVGTRHHGIYILDKNHNIEKHITTDNGLSLNYIMYILQRKNGDMIVGTTDGLNILKSDAVVQVLTTHDGLANNFSFNAYEDADQNLWICGNEGLTLITKTNVFNFNVKTGLPSNSVFDIIADKNNNFWLPTNIGIMKVDRAQLLSIANGNKVPVKAVLYNKFDGMKSDECIGASKSIIDQNGNLWVCTSNGVVTIETNNLQSQTINPRIIIEKIITDNKVFYPGDKIVVPSTNRRLQIIFSALYYTAPADLQFKYQLQPFESKWNTSESQLAEYSKVPYGNLVFNLQVENLNSDQKFNQRITIKVLPAWYESWYFRAGIPVILTILAFLVYYFRIKSIERKNIKLEELILERTTELRQKSEEIMAQAEQLENANKTLEKEKNIITLQNTFITSSINYAKTIQESILPPKEKLNVYFDSFIIYRPKDIVSGDFYWYSDCFDTTKNIRHVFVAAVDCTGHGVPGAFMSMIGDRLLNSIINIQQIYEPSMVTNLLNKQIIGALNQNYSDNSDGMDLVLCRFTINSEHKTSEIVFSGSRRPLITYNQLEQNVKIYKGNRAYIGGVKSNKSKSKSDFICQTIPFGNNEMFYLTTDGFVDQNNEKRIRFGTSKLLGILKNIGSLPCSDQKQLLENKLEQHQKDQKQRDDITFIGLKLKS